MNINGEIYLLRPGVERNVHAGYFHITAEGVLSLKPEFRGEPARDTYPAAISDRGRDLPGSRGGELPEHLILPDTVEGISVKTLADGIFCGNKVIRTVTWTQAVTAIPAGCFRDSLVEEVCHTEQITTVGANAFHNSNLRSAYLPMLTTLGKTAFCQCSHLTRVHIGQVTQIPTDAFFRSRMLSCLEGAAQVTTIGGTALTNTNSLVKTDLNLENMQSIGAGAFNCTGLPLDWKKVPASCQLGSNATPHVYNPTDFWSSCTPQYCKNPLPTLLTQWDTRWKDRPIGTSGHTWGAGCLLFAGLHAYCGLNNLQLSHVREFEEMAEAISPGILNTYRNGLAYMKAFWEPLGLKVTEYATFDGTTLQALYDGLKNGKYAMIGTSDGKVDGRMNGHAVAVYGVTADGKLLIADSDWRFCNDRTVGVTYAVPYNAMTLPDYPGQVSLCILEKAV